MLEEYFYTDGQKHISICQKGSLKTCKKKKKKLAGA